MSFHKPILSALLIAALAACGGGGSKTDTSSSTTTTATTAASAMPAASSNAMGGSMQNGSMQNGSMSSSMKGMAAGMASDPSALNCGAVKPVWVNTKSHAYHEANDPYYGKTKHGGYMCPAAAKKAGYHASGGAMMKSSKDGESDND